MSNSNNSDAIALTVKALEFYAEQEHEQLFSNDCNAERFTEKNPAYQVHKKGWTEDGAVCVEDGSVASEALEALHQMLDGDS